MSIVRDQLGEEHSNAFGNVSQTYRFTVDIDYNRLSVTPSEVEKYFNKFKKIIRVDDWFED